MNRREATALLLALGAIRTAATHPSPREAGLIDRLIASVASSKEVIFIRNGTDATPGAAARRVQDKHDYFRKDIATADDFIRLCGTRSEVTKRPDEVRCPDGHRQPAAERLGAQLKRMRIATK